MRSGAWVETMDEWGQASWRNTLTGEVSWLQPKGQSAAASGSSVRVDDLPVLADRDQIAVTGHLTVGEEAQPRGNIALLPDEENFSSSCDEDLPTSGDSFSFFSQRQERRVAQLDRRRNKAIIAARKALTFLEEQVHSGFEDDTPVFVDVQALRALAAGDNNWKYVSRKERKAARIRTEALRIANEKETRALEEVISASRFLCKAPEGANQKGWRILGTPCRSAANTGTAPTGLRSPDIVKPKRSNTNYGRLDRHIHSGSCQKRTATRPNEGTVKAWLCS